ncbi:MAG: hypothetical protein JWM57_323 [Phycisphaerales bacterium]|nr:hypothetical protein [Phycisphaerales bacterium]
MILGILSDTHGDYEIATRAIRLLREHGAKRLIHCGDVGDERVLAAMAGMPSTFTFGNNDWDHDELEQYGNAIGIDCVQFGGGLLLDGKYVAITHGDNPRTVARFCEDPQTDYLLTGHSHVRQDKRVGRVRWINPGALYRAAVKSVATLDLATDTLEFIEVPDE